jgi:hypothetical protein
LGQKKILDYLNIRYVLRLQGGKRAGKGKEDSPFFLLENHGALPKWFSVEKAVPAGAKGEDLARYGSPSFDLSKECFIADSAKAGIYGLRKVRETGREADKIKLSAQGPGKSLLVSSELAYPGWREKVRGNLRPMEIVNHDFRGISLEPGEEEAEVIYLPTSFRMGCFFSLLAVAVWAGLALGFLRDIGKRK